MRMNTQRILAALLSLVLLLALAPAGWADGEETGGGETGGETGGGVDASILTAPMPATGVNLNPGANTVNINLVPKDKEGTKFESDIVKANLVADLYLVAAAVKDENYDTYHYEFVGNAPVVIADANIFQDSLADDPDPEKQNKQETMLRTFSPLAQAFAKSIFTYEGIDAEKFPTKTAAATGTTIKVEGLDPGLYMLVLHGSDLKQQSENEDECYVTTMTKTGGGQYNEYGNADIDIVATRAFSKECEFIFEPQMITVPTKVVYEGEEVIQQYNTAYGEWSNVLNITAKPTFEYRFGNLKLVKTLTNYAGNKPVVAVFHVKATNKGKTVFSDVYMFELSKDTPTQTVTIEKRIPIGAEVEVTEEYSSSYKQVGTTVYTYETETGVEDAGTPLIELDRLLTATITNKPGETPPGAGVINRITYHSAADWGINHDNVAPKASGEQGGEG